MNNKWIFRIATKEDAAEIGRVMQKVYERMDNKTLFVPSGPEEILAHIETEGFTVGAYDPQGKMAGNFIVRYPMDAEDNLGRDLGLPEEELCKVAHMESAVVLPEYRGHHLQIRMLQYAESLIDRQRFCYFMATVSPDNPASYRSMEANGYQHVMTKEKYGGLLRRIYCKYCNKRAAGPAFPDCPLFNPELL